jgi:hypothetical protein
MDVRFIDPREAVLTAGGVALDAIGSMRDVNLPRNGIETDADYRARLMRRLGAPRNDGPLSRPPRLHNR